MCSKLVLVVIAAMVAGLLIGCAGAGPAQSGDAVAPGTLVVKGRVDSELSLTKEALLALGTIKFRAEHPKKGMQSYEGVPIKALLDKAGVKSDAKEILLIAGDQFTATVALADLAKCQDCSLVEQDGKMGAVFPGLPSGTWVRDIISIEVK